MMKRIKQIKGVGQLFDGDRVVSKGSYRIDAIQVVLSGGTGTEFDGLKDTEGSFAALDQRALLDPVLWRKELLLLLKDGQRVRVLLLHSNGRFRCNGLAN